MRHRAQDLRRRQAAGGHGGDGGQRLTALRVRAARAPARAAVLAAVVLLGAAPAAADYAAGRAAHDAGDFAAAWAAWTEAAIAGDGRAQFALGQMLANGAGVERDVISAYAWFALADAAGVAGARERFELLLREHIPRHCHYDALKLARDFQAGRPERLAEGGRRRSRCWRIR